MLNFVDNLSLKLIKAIKASDSTLLVAAMDLPKLNQVGIGNHIYLTLKQNNQYEVVRYDHLSTLTATAGNVPIAVTRDVNGTGAKNFGMPLCATADMNKTQMAEFICQTLGTCA